ncbi:MAG: thioredoxin family protein [Bacilli bacterium]|jgi:predicted bacteriocin transport accessory protein
MKKKGIITWVVCTFIVLVFSILISNMGALSKKEFTELTFKDYLNVIKEDKYNAVYIGSNDCPYCQMIEPELARLVKENKIKIYYLEASSLDFKRFDYKNLLPEKWGTPLLVIYKDKKLIDFKSGYTQYEELLNFLEGYY